MSERIYHTEGEQCDFCGAYPAKRVEGRNKCSACHTAGSLRSVKVYDVNTFRDAFKREGQR